MEECLVTEHTIEIVTTLLVQHILTLIVLTSWIRTTHQTVEIAHPMYRILYQEMVVLTLLSSMNAFIMLLMPILEVRTANIFGGMYMVINFAALMFHQITCLSVACIR